MIVHGGRLVSRALQLSGPRKKTALSEVLNITFREVESDHSDDIGGKADGGKQSLVGCQ